MERDTWMVEMTAIRASPSFATVILLFSPNGVCQSTIVCVSDAGYYMVIVTDTHVGRMVSYLA
jgi:hypothetical protein